jgi:APA family basic amino acid/polyamine antiporter
VRVPGQPVVGSAAWADYRIALYLLGAGVVLWAVNYFVHGKVEEFDPEKLAK